VRSEEGTRDATWAYIGSGGSTTAYGYDGAGRLTRRKRTSYYSLGGQNETAELDAVEYRSWDARGRPTAGILSAGGESEPLVLMYDDAARHVEASNGESVTRDADGNMAPCHQVPSP
jgi:YD repeat-containing protein